MNADSLLMQILNDLKAGQEKFSDELVIVRECLTGLRTDVTEMKRRQCPRPGFCIDLEGRLRPVEDIVSQQRGAVRLGTILISAGSAIIGALLVKLL